MPVTGQGLKFIWFPQNPGEVDNLQFFRDLTGQEPDATRSNKTPQPTSPFLSMAEGAVGDFQIATTLDPGRLLLMFGQARSAMGGGLPSMDVSGALKFGAKMIGNAKELPPAHRISCVADVMYLAESQQGAAKLFSDFVGFDPGFEDATDHLFQINRKCDFADVKGNRLVQVSVGEIQIMTLVHKGSSVQPIRNIQYGLNVSYDFNTIPDGTVMSGAKQVPIFNAIAESLEAAMGAKNLQL